MAGTVGRLDEPSSRWVGDDEDFNLAFVCGYGDPAMGWIYIDRLLWQCVNCRDGDYMYTIDAIVSMGVFLRLPLSPLYKSFSFLLFWSQGIWLSNSGLLSSSWCAINIIAGLQYLGPTEINLNTIRLIPLTYSVCWAQMDCIIHFIPSVLISHFTYSDILLIQMTITGNQMYAGQTSLPHWDKLTQLLVKWMFWLSVPDLQAWGPQNAFSNWYAPL